MNTGSYFAGILFSPQDRVHILLWDGDRAQAVGLHQHLYHRLGQEDRYGRAQVHIFDSQGQQSQQQDIDRLLLIPREHQSQGAGRSPSNRTPSPEPGLP